MKTLFLTLILMLVFGSVQFAAAQKDQSLTVKINQQKTIPGSKVTIKFVSLMEDSRCPRDVRCMWAGNARIQIQVTKGRESKTFELNSFLKPGEITFAGYDIKFAGINPKPPSTVKIDRNDYWAAFTVSKAEN